MNIYYELILKVCKDFTREEWLNCKEDETIFSDWDLPYEIIRTNLNLSDIEFEEYRRTQEFNLEWNEFCEAEQLLIKANVN